MENITIKIYEQYPSRFQLMKRLARSTLRIILPIYLGLIIIIILRSISNGHTNPFTADNLLLYAIPAVALIYFIALIIIIPIQSYYLWHTTIYLRKDAIYLIRNVSNKFIRRGFRVPYPYIQFILESEDCLTPYFSIGGRNQHWIDIPVMNRSDKLRLKSFFDQMIDSKESIIIPSSGFIKPKHIRERFKVLPKKECKLGKRSIIAEKIHSPF